MGMFSRAHSGNLNTLRKAIHNWQSETDYNAVVSTWFDPVMNRHCVRAVIVHIHTREVLIEKDFTDYLNIHDEDVQTVAVATWFNKQFNDYTGRFL